MMIHNKRRVKVWRPHNRRFFAGGVPGRIRSQLPGFVQQTCSASISQLLAELDPSERQLLLKIREVSADSARATFAPGTPLRRAL